MTDRGLHSPWKSRDLLRSLLSLASRQRRLSPLLVGGVLFRAVTNLGLHRNVSQLLRSPLFAETAIGNPRFALKFLFPDYLAKSFTVAERLSCLGYHHSRMCALFPDDLLRRMLQGEATLHEIPSPEHQLVLTLGSVGPCDKEGELSINLHVDGEVIYTLSFTIVPGKVVGLRFAEILLVTRLQGTPGCYSKIRMCARAMHDVGPDALLFAAVQGVATAFGIDEIAAVSAVNQGSYEQRIASSFKKRYDEFYVGAGLSEAGDGFFSGKIPVEGKPLALVRRSHKQRTREQRAFKQEVNRACTERMLQKMKPLADILNQSSESLRHAQMDLANEATPGTDRCTP